MLYGQVNQKTIDMLENPDFISNLFEKAKKTDQGLTIPVIDNEDNVKQVKVSYVQVIKRKSECADELARLFEQMQKK